MSDNTSFSEADEPMPVEAYDGAEQGIEPSIDLMLLHIGVGLPRAQGLAERKAAFKIVRGMERQLAELGTDGAKSLFHSLQETRRQLAETRDRTVLAEEAIRHLRAVADEYGAGTELWNAIAHEERAKQDGVWSPDVWALLREATP